jgi:hypothetical protein
MTPTISMTSNTALNARPVTVRGVVYCNTTRATAAATTT